MRAAVIVLVLANLAYFAWGSWQASQVGYWLPHEDLAYPHMFGERLVLRAELEGTESVATPLQDLSVPVSVTDAHQCLSVGPFGSESVVVQWQQRLLSHGVSSELRTEHNSAHQDYWVHIPPLPSTEQAMRLLRELQAQRIDSFVITQGDLANGISLGLYPNRERAESVSRRLKDFGYKVAVKPLPAVPGRWWLEMDAAAEAELEPLFWDQAEQQFAQLQRHEIACQPLALAETEAGHQAFGIGNRRLSVHVGE